VGLALGAILTQESDVKRRRREQRKLLSQNLTGALEDEDERLMIVFLDNCCLL